MSPDAYFVPLDANRYRPTAHTGGGWTTTEQHFSPIGGLLTHAIDRFVAARGTDGLITSRIIFDILGTIAIEPFDVTVEVVRAGRTIELVEANAIARGRPVVRARAWRLAGADTRAIAGGQPEPLPPPGGLEVKPLSAVWPGGYIASLEQRPIVASPGRATVWLRTPVALVQGEEASGLARFVMLLDTANGIASRESPDKWFYPNVDLTLHLYRQPRGDWVGLDTTVIFGAAGVGLTESVVHDIDGPVGRVEQILTIRPAA